MQVGKYKFPIDLEGNLQPNLGAPVVAHQVTSLTEFLIPGLAAVD